MKDLRESIFIPNEVCKQRKADGEAVRHGDISINPEDIAMMEMCRGFFDRVTSISFRDDCDTNDDDGNGNSEIKVQQGDHPKLYSNDYWGLLPQHTDLRKLAILNDVTNYLVELILRSQAEGPTIGYYLDHLVGSGYTYFEISAGTLATLGAGGGMGGVALRPTEMANSKLFSWLIDGLPDLLSARLADLEVNGQKPFDGKTFKVEIQQQGSQGVGLTLNVS